MNKKMRIVAPLVLSAAALLLASCSGGPGGVSGGDSGDTIKIGVLVSQTGSASQLGTGEVKGAELAAKQINADGGIDGKEIELVPLDDTSTPDQALQLAKQLIKDNVTAVIGPSVTASCKAVQPLFANGPVNYCLSPAVTGDSYHWTASASTAALADAGMAFWKEQGITDVAIVNSTDASGEDGGNVSTAAAEKAGMNITDHVTFDPTAVSITPQLQQAIAGDPEALVIWSTGSPMGVALKGVQELGIDVPILTTDGNLSNDFLESIKDYTPETLLFPATRDFWGENVDVSDEVTQIEEAYHSGFEEEYGTAPDFGPGVAYDAIHLIAEAANDAGSTDPDKVRDALEGVTGYDGVVGTYNFSADDHRGIDESNVRLVQAVDGKFVYVEGQ